MPVHSRRATKVSELTKISSYKDLPQAPGPLARREERLAWALLLPTLSAVALVVILPLIAIFWISFKPIELADLRAPVPVVKEDLRGKLQALGDQATLRYRLRNSSQSEPIRDVTLKDSWPQGLEALELDPRCTISEDSITCELGDWDGGHREKIQIPVKANPSFSFADDPKATAAIMSGDAKNILTNFEFTAKNFALIFNADEFFSVLWVTFFYAVFGTIGALLFGLFAALLLNKSFVGQSVLRGLYLFPYVAPVIAVAFAWVLLFDPFSGSANALLLQMGVTQEAINFFGARPLALIMVTIFEIWRYFPLSFLFILARMQSIDHDMYEAADMDGASPFQKFWSLSISFSDLSAERKVYDICPLQNFKAQPNWR
ncbi:MAG: sugar ABC transporter permease [Rhodobacteraceae bacterium]|nr:sugar ABC transporter permease [Paracoccaceae bacterium]